MKKVLEFDSASQKNIKILIFQKSINYPSEILRLEKKGPRIRILREKIGPYTYREHSNKERRSYYPVTQKI